MHRHMRRMAWGLVLAAGTTSWASAQSPSYYGQPAASDQNVDEAGVLLTAFQDEPATPAAAPPRAPARTGPTGSRQGNIRLASVPNMFGDVFISSGRVFTNDVSGESGQFAGGFDVPTAGGSRRVKVGENNKAMPDDRVYVMYNHFHNALAIEETSLFPPGPRVIRETHVDRFTAGFEKMFLDDLWSVEVRMPFSSSFDARTEAFAVDGGSVGNLAVILKNLLYTSDRLAIAGGVAFDTPTGSDVNAQLGDLSLSFQNDAFHILPYVGFVGSLNESFFMTGFIQVDIATSGNEVLVTGNAPESLGFLNEQNLLFLDLSAGYWLYRDVYAQRLTGIAAIGEVHYTTTLQDTDRIDATASGTPLSISNPFNRQDVVNITAALQVEIANTTSLRVAGVFPLGQNPDERFFDSELQLQLNRRF